MPVALVMSAANGVSSLICAPGDIFLSCANTQPIFKKFPVLFPTTENRR
jgi:hypothetical protein